MGDISKRLHRKLAKLATPGDKPGPPKGWRTQTPVPDTTKLIREGFDPVHTAYVVVQNLTSVFSENVSRFPEMRAYTQEVGSAEDEYMSSGPPMSPLTVSFFSCWAFFDHRIGKTTDTPADCCIEANESICLNTDQLGALKKMSQSRMGMYEHQGTQGNHVRLRELITDREFVCHITSGYRGKKGELWYVRLLPPQLPDRTYSIVFITPYVLIVQSKDDWIAFLKRSMVGMKGDGHFLKSCLCRGVDGGQFRSGRVQSWA